MQEIKENIVLQFKPETKEIKKLISIENGHFMISYLDDEILEIIIEQVENEMNIKITVFENICSFEEKFGDEIFICFIDNLPKSRRNFILYTLMEESKENVIIFATKNAMAVEMFEKRIRSRFSHIYVFIPYFDDIDCLPPTITNMKNKQLAEKYKIKKYEIKDLIETLNLVHLIILLLSHKFSINRLNVVSIFIKYRSYYKHINPTDVEIVNAFFDVVESEIIDKNGVWLINYNLFKKIISTDAPVFIQSMIYILSY